MSSLIPPTPPEKLSLKDEFPGTGPVSISIRHINNAGQDIDVATVIIDCPATTISEYVEDGYRLNMTCSGIKLDLKDSEPEFEIVSWDPKARYLYVLVK